MKKVFLFFISAFLALSAGAATLNDNFVASDGKVFQIRNVLAVEKGNGVIWVKQTSGTNQPFADATGAVWTKVINTYGFSQRFVRVGTTDKYMETTHSTEISCISNQSVFGYPSAPAEYFNDGCALQNAVKALSN